MNNLKNSVRLIGHMGASPEVKSLDNGNKMARFSLATNEHYTDKKGEKQTNTEWHNVVAWGKTAELAEQLLQKGTEVAIEGKLTNRTWEKDGEKKYITEVVVNELLVLSKKN
jgi:single-strand DNA-binding protein